MKPILIILLSFFTSTLFSQTINQLDEKGKKHGPWKAYIDKNWKQVKDSSKASHFWYTHYEHGYEIYRLADRKGLVLEHTSASKGKVLDGEYRWKDKKGDLRYVDVFENGKYITYSSFKNGKKNEFAEYTKQWRSEPNTFRLSIYRNDKVQYYFLRNGNKGWMLYPGSEDGK